MAHYWGRLAQEHGHRVTLVPPAYVRPYVRRSKTDRADAEALLEAVRSGEMPSVPVKRREQHALVALHRVREQWMTTRTARINTLRGILREHGAVVAVRVAILGIGVASLAHGGAGRVEQFVHAAGLQGFGLERGFGDCGGAWTRRGFGDRRGGARFSFDTGCRLAQHPDNRDRHNQ